MDPNVYFYYSSLKFMWQILGKETGNIILILNKTTIMVFIMISGKHREGKFIQQKAESAFPEAHTEVINTK